MGYQREYYRGRRERRNPFGDQNLAQLGKVYADIPIYAMQTAMTDLNSEYIRNRDLQDKYESALASAEVMAGDDVKKQQYIQGLRDKVDQFTQDTDGAYETGDNFVRGLARDVGNNEWLYKAMQNKKKFEEGEAAYKEDMRRGLNPQYFKPEGFTTEGIGPDGKTSLNEYDYYIGKGVDMDPTMQTFFEDLKANKSTYIDDFMNITTNTGVSNQRVQQVVEEGFQGLKQTDAYQQDLQNKRAQAQYTGVPFDEAAYDAQRKQEFAAVGERFVYNQKDRNPNRALFNAQLAARQKATSNQGNTTQWRQGAIGRRNQIEDESWLKGGDDKFSFSITNSKVNPTYAEAEPTMRRFNQPIVYAGNDRTTGAAMKSKTYGNAINTQATGEVVTTPFVVGPNPGYNAELINQAFEDAGKSYKYNYSAQKDYKDEMPYEGNIGGSSVFAGGRWNDVEGFDPKTLRVKVGSSTDSKGNPKDIYRDMSYILMDGEPVFVENRAQQVYNIADNEGNLTGEQVYAQASPEIASLAGFANDIGYSSISLDSSGLVSNSGNRIQNSIEKLDMIDPLNTNANVNYARRIYKNINNKIRDGKKLTPIDLAQLEQVDKKLMPQVFKQTSFEWQQKNESTKPNNTFD